MLAAQPERTGPLRAFGLVRGPFVSRWTGPRGPVHRTTPERSPTMSLVIAALAALALLTSSPSSPSSPSGSAITSTAPAQQPSVYDAIPPIGL